MLALMIIGGILLLIFLLLLVPVRLRFSLWDSEMSASVHYLFFRFRILPLPEEKEPAKKKKKAKKEPEPKSEKEEKPQKDKQPFSEKWEKIRGLIRSAKKSVALLCRHVVIYKLHAEVVVARPDAHKTALAYAKTTSFGAILLEVLDWAFVLKKPRVRISPDFTREKSVYNVAFRVRIRPLFAIIAGLQVLFAFLKTSSKKSKQKGGQQYESAASHR